MSVFWLGQTRSISKEQLNRTARAWYKEFGGKFTVADVLDAVSRCVEYCEYFPTGRQFRHFAAAARDERLDAAEPVRVPPPPAWMMTVDS